MNETTDPTGEESPAEPDPAPPATPHPRKPHGCVIGIRAAWDMVARGQSREAAAEWLSRNYPQHFSSVTDAGNAMEAEKDHC